MQRLTTTILMLATIVLAHNALAQDAAEGSSVPPLSTVEELSSDATGKLNDAEPQGSEAITTHNGARFSGTFNAYRGGKIAFSDDDAGELELDPAAINGYRFKERVPVHFQRERRDEISQGKLEVRDDQLWLREDDGNVELITGNEYYKLQRDPYSRWEYNGSLASLLMLTDGNVESVNYGAFAFFQANHPFHVITFQAEAAYGETENVRSQQRAQASLEYNYMFLKHLGLLAREIVEHDDFKRLRTGSITTLGVTAPIMLAEEDYELSVEAGAIYVAEDYKGATDREYAGAEVGVMGKIDLEEGVKVVGSSRAYFNFKDEEDVMVKNRVALTAMLFSEISAGLVFEHDYDNRPAAGVERNDYRLLFLVGWSF